MKRNIRKRKVPYNCTWESIIKNHLNRSSCLYKTMAHHHQSSFCFNNAWNTFFLTDLLMLFTISALTLHTNVIHPNINAFAAWVRERKNWSSSIVQIKKMCIPSWILLCVSHLYAALLLRQTVVIRRVWLKIITRSLNNLLHSFFPCTHWLQLSCNDKKKSLKVITVFIKKIDKKSPTIAWRQFFVLPQSFFLLLNFIRDLSTNKRLQSSYKVEHRKKKKEKKLWESCCRLMSHCFFCRCCCWCERRIADQVMRYRINYYMVIHWRLVVTLHCVYMSRKFSNTHRKSH